jgi:O-antigen/teichoic acid export membrane protein
MNRGLSISAKVIKNTGYNLAGYAWSVLVSLILTPYIIHSIGVERFGIFAMVSVLSSLCGLFDLGIGASFVRYISEFHAKKDHENINQVLGAGFLSYAVFTLAIVNLYLLFSFQILRVFNIPPACYMETFYVFGLGILLFGLANAFSVFSSVQSGLQRMDILNKVNIFMSVPTLIGVVFFLERGYGLLGLMINQAIIFVLQSAVNVVIARKLLPGFRFRPFAFSRDIFTKIFNFGYKFQLAKISGYIASQTDKVLIAMFLSVSFVAYYELGNRIVLYVISVCSLMISALVPAFTEVAVLHSREKLSEAYLTCVKHLTFFIVPLFVCAAVLAERIIVAWVGESCQPAIMVIRILAVAWAVNSIAQVSASMSMAINEPNIMAKGSVLIVVLNLILSFIFVKKFGFLGVAFGTAVAVNVGSVYFIIVLNRRLGLSNMKFFMTIRPFFVVSVVSGLLTFGADAIFKFSGLSCAGPLQALYIAALAGVFAATYLLLVYRKKYVEFKDLSRWTRGMFAAGAVKVDREPII